MSIDELKRTPPRSWLFVPALKAPEWIPKATASGADAIIVDLEDATAPDEKERARAVVQALAIPPRVGPRASGAAAPKGGAEGDRREEERSAGSERAPAIVVRINSSPPMLELDIAAAVASGADGVVLPKVEGPWQIRRCAALLEEAESATGTGRRLAILPMIETARSVVRALDIADAHTRVAALMFGGGDLSAVVGWLRTRAGSELGVARALVVLAASAAGIGAVDTPWLDIKDTSGVRAETRAVRDMGFTGKFAIHPSHVGPIHEGFAPTDEEVADARGLIEAFERGVAAGTGVTTYKGRMIDRPDALQAERVLARAADRIPS